MRRLLIISACTTATLGAGLPSTFAAEVARQARPQDAHATLASCRTALAQADRYAVFAGSMRSLRRGQDRMQMRFDLYRRTPSSGRFQRIPGAGLSVWKKADPGVARFRFRQKVESLPVPGAYRAVVSFRWLTASGRVFARTQRTTPVCHQPDLRPDLRVGRIVATRIDRDTARYEVTVRNDGRSSAGEFAVALTVNGEPQAGQSVSSLPAAGRQTLEFVGPRCAPASRLQVGADPDDRVAEANEANNGLAVDCPLPAPATA